LVHLRRDQARYCYMQGQAATLRYSNPWAVILPQFEGNIIFMCQSYGAGH